MGMMAYRIILKMFVLLIVLLENIESLPKIEKRNNQNIEETDEIFKNVVALIKEELNSRDQIINQMHKRIESLEKQLNKKRLNEQVPNGKEEMNITTRENQIQSYLSFSARIRSGGDYYIPKGSYITEYNDVLINEGYHFDDVTGVFTAPHTGLYEFWFNGLARRDRYTTVELHVNSVVEKSFGGNGFYGDIPHGDTFNGRTILQLNAFDKVSLYCDGLSDNAIFGYGESYFQFTGLWIGSQSY